MKVGAHARKEVIKGQKISKVCSKDIEKEEDCVFTEKRV